VDCTRCTSTLCVHKPGIKGTVRPDKNGLKILFTAIRFKFYILLLIIFSEFISHLVQKYSNYPFLSCQLFSSAVESFKKAARNRNLYTTQCLSYNPLSGYYNLPACPFKRLQFFLINHVSSFNETWLLIIVVKNSGIASPGGGGRGAMAQLAK
jgi:hypothetical protein